MPARSTTKSAALLLSLHLAVIGCADETDGNCIGDHQCSSGQICIAKLCVHPGDSAMPADAAQDAVTTEDAAHDRADATCAANEEEACNEVGDDCDGETDAALFPCNPFILTGGRIAWTAGIRVSADAEHPYRFEGRGRVLDSRALRAEAPDGTVFELRPAGLQLVGGLEPVGGGEQGRP